MEKAINITHEENELIYNLFSTYSSYMNMLQYLLSNGIANNSPFYDKKWKEAADLCSQLEKEKHNIERKYKPKGEWDRFEFDFNNSQVVFVKHD